MARSGDSAPPLSDAEWVLMRCLWRSSPRTVREVLDEVREETGWAYSTVKTMLSRLVEKGAVEASTRGNTRFFTPRLGRATARAAALAGLLDRAFDGALPPLIQQLAREQRLSADERARLTALLAELDDADGEHDG